MRRREKPFPVILPFTDDLPQTGQHLIPPAFDLNQSSCTNDFPLLGTCPVIILSFKKNTSKNILPNCLKLNVTRWVRQKVSLPHNSCYPTIPLEKGDCHESTSQNGISRDHLLKIQESIVKRKKPDPQRILLKLWLPPKACDPTIKPFQSLYQAST